MESFLPHLHECINCKNRKDPQYVMNSIILSLSIISLGFLVSFALNQALKETFEQMFPKSEELGAKWNYAIVILFSVIVVLFLLFYNLDGTKF